MNDNKLLAISPTLPGLKATFFLPIYQVPDIVYPPFAYWEKCTMLLCSKCTLYVYLYTHNPNLMLKIHATLFYLYSWRKEAILFNCVKDSKLQNGTREAWKYQILCELQCQIKYSLQLKKLLQHIKFLYLQLSVSFHFGSLVLVVFGNKVTKILCNSLFILHLVLPILPWKRMKLYKRSCNLSDEKPKTKLSKYVMSRANNWKKWSIDKCFANSKGHSCINSIICRNVITVVIPQSRGSFLLNICVALVRGWVQDCKCKRRRIQIRKGRLGCQKQLQTRN